jgi:hypothetical protein
MPVMATSLPPPARFAGATRYEHTDIPAELTVSEWRARRHAARRSRGGIMRLMRRILRYR